MTVTDHRAPAEGRSETAAELAARHGLTRSGARPSLSRYLADVWSRRHFAISLAGARAYASNQVSYLGQLWAVLTPMLWAGVYLFVFGHVLDTSRGVDNFAAFLVIGVFLFRFTSTSLSAGASSVIRNQSLVSTLRFPRALLPVSVVLAELLTLLPALVVLLGVVLLTGEPPAWSWLLLPVAVLLQSVFGTGLALGTARMVSQVRDVANIVPFVTRALMYVSGVFFSIEHYAGPGGLGAALAHQPVAVYLELARGCLLQGIHLTASTWLWATGWALGALLVGVVWFWNGEEGYGRD
ncbi:ABC transporter permease [Nocardioides guangzhouensis]|uniref:Transport permease protein n=1 Tax=Nocardioides guangzhouensis TaxID=2497878 RepID=A0A4Q4ZIP3_9ACTN|nr:ABC transporter permease [Nocardioides guangzhouensis]RYP87778.1 ABC transporter permease [Nocardioides guangzhouensis]